MFVHALKYITFAKIMKITCIYIDTYNLYKNSEIDYA